MAADELSLTDWCVLAVLAEAPRHGFAVARELAPEAELGRVWTVRRPLVYRALEHLEARALVEPARVEAGVRGPERVVLRPTRRGRARLRAWLAEPVGMPREARTELLVKFVLLGRRGESGAPLAQRQRDRFAPVVTALAREARAASGSDRLVARWRLEAARAVQRTLDAVIADARVDKVPR